MLDTSCVLFTDETRVSFDEIDCCANGWVYFGDECHQRLRRQQQGGGVMMWLGIMGDIFVGPVRVFERMATVAYYNLLNGGLDPLLDDIPLSLLRNLIFMHDNTLSHSVRTTQTFLGSYGIQGERLMVWPLASLDINPIENLWSIVKQVVYADGHQFKIPYGRTAGAVQPAIIIRFFFVLSCVCL